MQAKIFPYLYPYNFPYAKIVVSEPPLLEKKLRPTLVAGAELAQEIPFEDAIIVPVLPEDGDAIGAGRNDVFQAGFACVDNGELENAGVGRTAHIVVTAATFGAGAGSPQQRECVYANVTIIPGEGEFFF